MGRNVFGNRLLVVDDEPSIGRIVKRVGESLGFEVVTTENPTEFLKITRSWQPTLIVLDLNIPGTDGIKLLRELAAERCTAEVVVSSGEDLRVLESARQLGLERGLNMAGILPKPMRLEALREFLAAFMPVVFAAAAKQAATWRADNLNLEIAVNISATDVEDIELPVAAALHRCRHRPGDDGAGTHRDRGDASGDPDDGCVDPIAAQGLQAVDRRFRDRLFLPCSAATPPIFGAVDRQILCDADGRGGNLPGHRRNRD
jgi:DNA-binding response OmpR family regulator